MLFNNVGSVRSGAWNYASSCGEISNFPYHFFVGKDKGSGSRRRETRVLKEWEAGEITGKRNSAL